MNIKKSLIFGLLVWLIPFIVAFIIFPIHESNRPLFESIMPVVIVACVVLFSILYFNKVENGFAIKGLKLGLIWLFISLVIDLLVFMQGPMKMNFINYVNDIGITYLLIPIITFGQGFLVEKIKNNNL